MTDTPPDWVLLEAAKWGNFNREIESLQHSYRTTPLFAALCDMILKHEQPRVDRKLLCAREALQTEWLRGPQGTTATDQCIRAIELWEEGFGK